jgi:hypothetical protein
VTIQGANFQPGAKAALYGGGPYIKGSCDMPGSTSKVTLAGNYAYVYTEGMHLRVIDVSDPANPQAMGSCDTPGVADDVAVAGDYAYAVGWNGTTRKGYLEVINISNPSAPSVAGSCDTPGSASAVAVAGGYAYVAEGCSNLLTVIDVSEPAAPHIAGSCPMPSWAFCIALAGNYAYVAGSHGVRAVDISDPTNPHMVSNCWVPADSAGIAVAGSYAYAVGGEMQVVDVSNPANIHLVGTCPVPLSANGVAVAGAYAYLASGSYGLQVMDVSDPVHPRLVGSCPTKEALGVALAGDYAYVADGYYGGLKVIDISQPVVFDLVSSCAAIKHEGGGVAVAGGYACVSGSSLIDISDPASPQLAGSVSTPFYLGGAALAGNYAYLASGSWGLLVTDIGDPEDPYLVGACSTPSGLSHAAVAGRYAYATGFNYATWQGVFTALDISDPVSPIIVGSCQMSGTDVALAGNYAYVPSGSWGLQVVDITDPANPGVVATCNVYPRPTICCVAQAGGYAYVAGCNPGICGLEIIDVSNPLNPRLVGSCDIPGGVSYIAVAGGYAYLAGGGGLQVVDVSDPTRPRLVGDCSMLGQGKGILGVTLAGDYAYAVAAWGGLQVLGLFQPLANVAYVNSGTLTATIPHGQRPGTRNLHVTNPDGGHAVLRNSFTVTACSADCPPTLDHIGNKRVNRGELLQFTVSATDPDPGQALTFSAGNLPPGAGFDPATRTFTWTPDEGQAGTYPDVLFTVTDNGSPPMNDSEAITITVTPASSNQPPNAPSNPTPANGATRVGKRPTLAWTCSDPDPGDTLAYDVYLGENPGSLPLVATVTTPSWHTGFLDSEATYYWQVVARDNLGAQTPGPVWSFTTNIFPTIESITPEPALTGQLTTIQGYNFAGTPRWIKVGTKYMYAGDARIISWTENQIVFRMFSFGWPPGTIRVKPVQVKVNAKTSNIYSLSIKRP